MSETLDSRADQLFAQPDETMLSICRHVAGGGSLIELCEIWEVRYSDIVSWVRADKDRSRTYDNALNDRSEWAKERILLELKRIGMADIRLIFSEDGSIKPVNEWPSEVASFVQSIETVEEFEGSGRDKTQIGWNKKVKLWNKEKALELLGKNLHLFIDRIDHTAKISLEDLITASRESGES